MVSKKNTFWKRFIFFIVLEGLFIWLSLFCWGFYGKVGPKRFRTMISFFRQEQKQTLCNSLNFYYERGIAKYTTNLVLSCEPETESMVNQFMWFHRNALTYFVKDNASYHDVLVSTLDYFDLLEGIDTESVSTYYLERKLINWQEEQEKNALTNKDKNSLLLTLLDTGGTFLLASGSPVGVGISALNLLHKAGSDPAKCVPAIVVFKRQRENNFLWMMAALTIFNLLLTLIVFRKRKGKS